MRVLFQIALLLSSKAYATGAGTRVDSAKWTEAAPREWISRPVKVWERTKDDSKCYLFDSYWVATKSRTEEVGEYVFVFGRDAKMVIGQFPGICDMDSSKAWISFREPTNFFAAISNDFLYIDSGTGTSRGMAVISLKDKKQLASFEYQISGTFSFSGDDLVYKGPLSEYEDRSDWKFVKKCKWRPDQSKGQFQEDFSGTRRINLKTFKVKISDVICEIGPAAG